MSVVRHTSYNLAGAVIPIIVGLVTVPLYLRLVGTDRFGILSLAWLLLGYFGLFDLGLGRAASYRIAALRRATAQARADSFWAALTVNLGMGAVGGAILWVAGGYFFAHAFKVSEEVRSEIMAALPLLAACVPASTLGGVLTGAMQGREKFFEVNVVSALSTVLFQLIPLLIAWAAEPSLPLLIGGALAARLIGVAVLAYQCHAEITRGQPWRLVPSEASALLKYGAWVTVTSILSPMLVISDRFVIGAMLGASDIAVYSVAFQVAQRISTIPTALATALFPKMSAASFGEQRALGEKAIITLASVMTLPVLAAIFLLEPFLELWVGKKIAAQGGTVGMLLLVGFWINGFAQVPYTKLQASGRPDLVAKVHTAEIVPYFLTLYLGIMHLGLVGSALAFSARCALDFLLLAWLAGTTIETFKIIGMNLLVLALAVYVAESSQITEPRWWLYGLALSIPVVVLGWRKEAIELITTSAQGVLRALSRNNSQ